MPRSGWIHGSWFLRIIATIIMCLVSCAQAAMPADDIDIYRARLLKSQSVAPRPAYTPQLLQPLASRRSMQIESQNVESKERMVAHSRATDADIARYQEHRIPPSRQQKKIMCSRCDRVGYRLFYVPAHIKLKGASSGVAIVMQKHIASRRWPETNLLNIHGLYP